MSAKMATILIVAMSGGPLPVETDIAMPKLKKRIARAPGLAIVGIDATETAIPAQRTDDGERLRFVLPPTDDEGERCYAIIPQPAFEPAFSFEEADDTYLRLMQGDEPVLTYNFGDLLPEGVPEDRRRSSYIHPLFGLDGEEITGDFPKDHYHHRGVFLTWPHVTVGGKHYDPWAVSGMWTRFEEWLGRETGPVFASFGVQNGWYADEKRVMDEKVRYTVWLAGDTGRAIDVSITLEATEEPVTLLGATDKGYGGFCLRVPVVESKTVTKPDGTVVQSTNEERIPWADISAKMSGGEVMSGASIFIDSDNIGFPNGWCLREYGFLGVDWPGLEEYTLQPGEPVELNYRVWVHRGDVTEGQSAEAYANFAEPVGVAVSSFRN